tara:strand:+ start:1646 stop:2203 length:558 start_codon:yes stop_codon:yes gene_type:complete
MKNYITLLLILLTLSVSAQEENELKPWRLKAATSFAPGLLTENTKTIQLQATLGFIKDKIELRGDGFYFLNSFGDRPRFTMNHQLFAGAFYRFSEKKFQPYLGFQPGIAMSQSSEFGSLNVTTQKLEYKVSYNPLGSLSAGFDFFGKKWFYLFTEARYIFGKHKSNTYPVYLDEIRLSFGLGFTL